MLALHLLAYIVYYAGDRWIHNRSEIVFHGVSSGVPVSARHRRMVLTNAFIPVTLTAVVMLVIMALGFIGLARNVSDAFVESFALVCAFAYGLGALGIIAFGVVWFAYLLSVVREAKRD